MQIVSFLSPYESFFLIAVLLAPVLIIRGRLWQDYVLKTIRNVKELVLLDDNVTKGNLKLMRADTGLSISDIEVFIIAETSTQNRSKWCIERMLSST